MNPDANGENNQKESIFEYNLSPILDTKEFWKLPPVQ